MSLVDGLSGVHVGDLIVLEGSNTINRVGYVADYSSKNIILSNAHTREKETGGIRNLGFLDRYRGEKISTFPLRLFDSYRILEAYKGPEESK